MRLLRVVVGGCRVDILAVDTGRSLSAGLSVDLDESQVGRLADAIDGIFDVFDARQTHAHAVVALPLHDDLRGTAEVGAFGDDRDQRIHRFFAVSRRRFRQVSLEHQLGTTLQIQTLLDLQAGIFKTEEF